MSSAPAAPLVTRREYPAAVATALSTAGVPQTLARVFAARGVRSLHDLETRLAHLLPPSSLAACDQAAERLADAIARRERILIVADYDCDGATACAVAIRALRAFGGRPDYLVPNRFEHGYGLTPGIVRLAAERRPDLLITVDNGIASVDGVAEANRLGIEVLVTDHHLPGDARPQAPIIVNPNQAGDTFASKHIAGVGVIFYVMLATRGELRRRGAFTERPEPNLATLLDLVALGTVADVVRLDANNRILVHQGLLRLRNGQGAPGLRALFEVAGKRPESASPYDLAFVAGPRLNAAGRLTDMSLGVACLLAEDSTEAAAMARQLDQLNRERRAIEAHMQEAALDRLDMLDGSTAQCSTTLYDPNWHQGVIGIVASRLKDRLHRPAICFAAAGDGVLKGSGRSIAGLHLRDALDWVSKRHPDLLLTFGGHAAAAGLSLRAADLPRFQAAFESVCREWLTPEDLHRVIATDGPLDRDQYSFDFARSLAGQVWGQGFAEPLFEGSFTVLDQRILAERHSRVWLEGPGGRIGAIRFGSVEKLPKRVDAVFRLGMNEFRGEVNLQLQIEHIG
jgi:single-stranded-DNA-specific exonuclease